MAKIETQAVTLARAVAACFAVLNGTAKAEGEPVITDAAHMLDVAKDIVLRAWELEVMMCLEEQREKVKRQALGAHPIDLPQT